MPIELKPLPYSYEALEPHISRATVETHYEKHHRGYVENVNALIAGTRLAESGLEDILRFAAGNARSLTLFNNAAQAWNHDFYWKSMAPSGGGEPPERVRKAIERSFGGVDRFHSVFSESAREHFGSGWVWLVQDGGALKVLATPNADTPLVRGMRPLLVLDVWEHAYYLDRRNRRSDYIMGFLDALVNWSFVDANLESDTQRKSAAE